MISQGDQGETLAVAWVLEQGWRVALPLGNCADYDLIADTGDRVLRVQVKTTRFFRGNRWDVSLATRGGNQSWSGLVKCFSASRCDALYVHTAPGRRWFIPARAVEGGTMIRLGGPKYAVHEVDEGPPLTLSSPPRRDSGAVKRARL